MAVYQSSIWQAAPGRGNEVIGHMAHAKRIHSRHGAGVRALSVQVGGTGSLRLAYVLRFADMANYASVTGAVSADPEWQAFQQTRLASASPSATLVSNSIARELPGFEGPFVVTGKSVTLLTMLRPSPGGMERFMAEAAQVKEMVGRRGGSSSVRQALIAGDVSGNIAFSVTFEDLASMGRGLDALLADPDYAALQGRLSAPDSPVTVVGRTLATELPI